MLVPQIQAIFFVKHTCRPLVGTNHLVPAFTCYTVGIKLVCADGEYIVCCSACYPNFKSQVVGGGIIGDQQIVFTVEAEGQRPKCIFLPQGYYGIISY